MNFVEPIREPDDIQAMKDYLKEWNERNYMLFVFGINLGFETSLKTVEAIALKDCNKTMMKPRKLDKPLEQCGLMSAT